MNNTVNQQDDGNPLKELVAFGKKWVRITGDGATDHICHSANITSGYFFNSVAVFFLLRICNKQIHYSDV